MLAPLLLESKISNENEEMTHEWTIVNDRAVKQRTVLQLCKSRVSIKIEGLVTYYFIK